VAEPLRNYNIASGQLLDDRVAVLFDRVELPRSFLLRFPYKLSGGQRQRVAIALALSLMMELQSDLGFYFCLSATTWPCLSVLAIRLQ
tara:strand:+ start:57 stop:320 length:264 start_codon:yes stop_codon:yes gene_type:complete